ncbi:hypothetical protein [Parasphingorhabdus pacifica]
MRTASSTDTGSRRPRAAVLAAAVLLAVSAVAATFFGVSWAIAATDDSLAYAAEREEVLTAGRQGIVNFNTLDHRNVQKGLDLWAKSSTGPLHDEVVKGREENAKRITEAKSTTKGEVLEAAVSELDMRAGKAKMIAVVKVTVTKEGQQPVDKRSRYQAKLARDGEEWKLSSLGPVSVG